MARVLGLDLGSHSIKAAVMETTLRGFALKRFFSTPVGAEPDAMARLGAALPALWADQPMGFDQVVVSIPGVALATHLISLPFSEPKKIDQAIGFEIESQLPYEISEASFDYQVAASDEAGASLLVGVLRKSEMSALLALLQAAKLDPRIVTHPALVYQNLLAQMPASPAEANAATAIIDLGHERVSVAIGRAGGGVEQARTFAGGGLALTKALAKEFNIGLSEAASWKEAYGALGEEAIGADAQRAAQAFSRALQPILRELRPTLKSYTARTKRPVAKVLLCGGTAKLKGSAAHFERELGIPVCMLPSPPAAVGTVGADVFEAAQAIALALRGTTTGAKAPRFNLRRREFTFRSDFDAVRGRLGQLGAFAAILVVMLIASGMVRNSVLERREQQINQVLGDITERILGKRERDFSVALNLLRGQESPAAGIPKRSAASLLAELIARVPSDMPITFGQITIDLDRIALRCEAGSSKNMEDLVAALKLHRCFKEIKEGKLEKNKDGTKVTFRLDIQVQCPEDNAST